jgi:hypothetical protein
MITKLALCSREVVRDAATNNISVFSIFEALSAAGFPLLLNPFSALFVLEREHGDATEVPARFQLLLGDTELLTAPTQINFEDRMRTRQMVRLNGLVITAPGVVHAKLWVGEHLQAEYSFVVEGPAQPEVQMTTASA